MPTCVFHIITGLDCGGAENMLLKLVQASDPKHYRHVVYVLTPAYTLLPAFAEAEVEVRMLNIHGLNGVIQALISVIWDVRKEQPKIVMSWLHHADLFAALVKVLQPQQRIIWNIRCSKLDLNDLPRSNIFLVRLLAKLSFLPNAVITNSLAGKNEHIAVGYKPRQWIFLPNGFDLERFHPDPLGKTETRDALGLTSRDFVIGVVGRYHPMKGYGLLAEAAALIQTQLPSARFVVVGKGLSSDNHDFVNLLQDHNVLPKMQLLGMRDDIPALMRAFDVLLSTSTSEGFPNVIGEAMASGTPCVSTDVGDCRIIIGNTGFTVAQNTADDIAKAVIQAATIAPEELDKIGIAARKRIEDNYSITKILGSYQNLYINE